MPSPYSPQHLTSPVTHTILDKLYKVNVVEAMNKNSLGEKNNSLGECLKKQGSMNHKSKCRGKY